MKYLATYALLVLGGNANPSEDDMGTFLKEVGVAVDKERLATMITRINDSGKSITELIHEGEEKFAKIVPGAQGDAVAVAEVPDKEVIEDKKDDDDLGGEIGDLFGDGTGLFGDDEDY